MHFKKLKTLTAVFLTLTLTAGMFQGCSGNSETGKKYNELITIDVFDSLANYQGIQGGWFAKVVEDKFNMRLNIIAPNVSGGGSNVFDTRCAAGNIGDLIICSGDASTLNLLVNSGLILDMSSYLSDKEIMRFKSAIESINSLYGASSIYAIPSEICTGSAIEPSEVLEPTFGPYLRWDYYKELGYPHISTLEDLLPILKAMQDNHPVTESGEKVYAFSFFNDWDDNMANCVKQPCCFYGFDEIGFVLASADGKDLQNIADSDSIYVRVLRFFNEAYRMGLVDPESLTQNLDSVSNKTKEGAVLFSPWPWLSQSLFNNEERMNNGVGFMMAPIDDLKIFSYGKSIYGNRSAIICVGSNTKYADRITDFINWLYSDEGIYYNNAQGALGAAGPEGLTWEMTADGPVLTEFGEKCVIEMTADMPEEWGGGKWIDGASALNYKPVTNSEIATNGYTYTFSAWESYLKKRATKLDKDWQHVMGSFSTMDYLTSNNQLIVAPGCQFVVSDHSSEIDYIRVQCSETVRNYSWKMIFADSVEQFDSLLGEMQDTLSLLDYDKVLQLDLRSATAQVIARKQEAAKTATYSY